MNIFLMALLSITISVAAQFALKAGMSCSEVKLAMTQPWAWRTALTLLINPFVVGGFCLYGAGAVVWLGVLSKWDVSKAYPLVGLGFALTTLVGLVMGEQVSLLRLGGVVMICAGVFLISNT